MKKIKVGMWVKGTGKDTTMEEDIGKVVEINKDKSDKYNDYLIRWEIAGAFLLGKTEDKHYWHRKSDVKYITPQRAKKEIKDFHSEYCKEECCDICKHIKMTRFGWERLR